MILVFCLFDSLCLMPCMRLLLKLSGPLRQFESQKILGEWLGETIILGEWLGETIMKCSHLLKWGTTWKHLKPAENTQKLPETSNITVLKFSKLTEIWYSGTLIYPYFEFNVLSFIFFFGNLVPKSKVLQINWNLVKGCIAICLLRL